MSVHDSISRRPHLVTAALLISLATACSGGGDGGGGGRGSSASSLPGCVPGDWLIQLTDFDAAPCVDLRLDGAVVTASTYPGVWPDGQQGFNAVAPAWEVEYAQGASSTQLIWYTAPPITPESGFLELFGTYYLPAQDITVSISSTGGVDPAQESSCALTRDRLEYEVHAGRWINGSPPLGAFLCGGTCLMLATRVQGLTGEAPAADEEPVRIRGTLELTGHTRPYPVLGVWDPELRLGEARALGLRGQVLELVGGEAGPIRVLSADPDLLFEDLHPGPGGTHHATGVLRVGGVGLFARLEIALCE